MCRQSCDNTREKNSARNVAVEQSTGTVLSGQALILFIHEIVGFSGKIFFDSVSWPLSMRILVGSQRQGSRPASCAHGVRRWNVKTELVNPLARSDFQLTIKTVRHSLRGLSASSTGF